MSDPTPLLALDGAVLVVAFAWPRSRQIMGRWVREIVETPLRFITGRQRPDYVRIAQLEQELFSSAPKFSPGGIVRGLNGPG